MILQLDWSLGNRILLPIVYESKMADATANRNPANVKGAKYPKPTFIANHVEPQTKQSDAKTVTGRISLGLRFGMFC